MKAAPDLGDHRMGRRGPRGRPGRTLRVVLAAGGVLAGFAVTLGAVTAFRNDQHATPPAGAPPDSSGPSGPSARSAAPLVPAAGVSPASPAALGAQWGAYSGRSTCADWAGAD